MTHMHGDHAGGLDQFPNSEFIMAHDEAKAALSRLGRSTATSTCTIPSG